MMDACDEIIEACAWSRIYITLLTIANTLRNCCGPTSFTMEDATFCLLWNLMLHHFLITIF